MFIVDKAVNAKMHNRVATPKIIFFDIDDTLSRNGIIAEHNKATLEQLAKTDIKLVIATGRSKAIIPDDILALLDDNILDAIICMNGQYSFNKDGLIRVITLYPLSKMTKSSSYAKRVKSFINLTLRRISHGQTKTSVCVNIMPEHRTLSLILTITN